MAAKIGVDEETVRRRIRRARESGFLKGWQVILHPNIVDRESAGVHLTTLNEEKKLSALREIEQMDGVVILINFHENSLRVIFYHKDEQDFQKKIQQFKTICGSKEEPVLWRGGFPPSRLKLKRTDWEILRALRKDARRSPSEIADEVGVSSRTVKRRLTIMTKGLTFYLIANLDYDKYPGVAVDLLVFCPDSATKTIVDQRVRSMTDRIVFSFIEAKGFSIYALLCLNMAEAEKIRDEIRKIGGVNNVRMDTIRTNMATQDWLDREIENQLVMN
jgi:DNA-binding Lrp family transcriptional regulator